MSAREEYRRAVLDVVLRARELADELNDHADSPLPVWVTDRIIRLGDLARRTNEFDIQTEQRSANEDYATLIERRLEGWRQHLNSEAVQTGPAYTRDAYAAIVRELDLTAQSIREFRPRTL